MAKVTVDWVKCDGNGVCVDVCPVNVFEMQQHKEYPGTEKAVPVQADECIQCLVCMNSCPNEAITVKD
jgi:NAD-dependent dihydropyrimidine dehydrogenase PreA subunit